MSGSWPVVRLDEVAEVRLGRQRSPKNHDGDNMVPYLRAANVTAQGLALADVKQMHFAPAEVSIFRLQAGDVLVSEASGSPMEVGKSAVWQDQVAGDVCFQNTLLRVRAQQQVLPAFLQLVIENARRSGVFARRSRGVGMNHLTSKGLAHLELELPSLDEQEGLVRRSVDLQTQLAELRQPVVDLPLRVAALQQSQRRQLLEGLKRLRPCTPAEPMDLDRERVAARLGLRPRKPSPDARPALPIPAEWRWARWPEVGLVQNGIAFPSSDYADTGVRLLRPGNLHQSGRVVWTASNTRHLPDKYLSSAAKHIVGPGEILMNLTAQSLRDAFLGRVCMTPTADADSQPFLLNQRIARLVPIDIWPRYAFHLFRGPSFRAFVDALNSGSLIQHMHTKQLDHFYFHLPPMAEQQAIAAALDEVDSRAERTGQGVARVGVLSKQLERSMFQAVLGTPVGHR